FAQRGTEGAGAARDRSVAPQGPTLAPRAVPRRSGQRRDLRPAGCRARLPARAAAPGQAAVPLGVPAAPRRQRAGGALPAGPPLPAILGALNVDHPEAIEMGATEKYLLGELAPETRAEFEEHFFDCRECAEDVKVGAAFLDGAQELLAKEASREEQALAQSRRPWSPRRLFWPMPAGAALAAGLVLALAGYQSLVLLPRLRGELALADAPQAGPQFFLSVSRSEPKAVTVAPGQRMVSLTLSKSSDRSFPYYRCEVRDASGRVVQSAVVPGAREADELQLLLPVARLQPA